MRRRTYVLDESAEAEFDSDGVATATLGPGRSSIVWRPSIAAVSTSVGSADPAEARLYRGSPEAGQLLGGTSTGGQDSTDTPGVVLHAGASLTCQWTGGTPGATATLSVTGSYDVLGL